MLGAYRSGLPALPCRRASSSCARPSGLSSSQPVRPAALPLAPAARRPRRRQQERRQSLRRAPAASCTSGPGWDDWDDDSELVAQATSSTADAVPWGGWAQQAPQQVQQGRQAQQRHEQQQAAAGDLAGRQGETQRLQASTSGRSAAVPAYQVAAVSGEPSAGLSVGALARTYRHTVSHPIAPPPPPNSGVEVRYFTFGAIAAVLLHYLVNFAGTMPVVRGIFQRFVWWTDRPPGPPPTAPGASKHGAGKEGSAGGQEGGGGTTALAVQYSEDAESVEWVNMCWRKAWRVYQRGIERWLADLLQPLFDSLVAEKMVPSFVQRLRIMEFTLDHEAPYFTNMRRRTSRKDSDLNGVVDVRYTGGARMLLLIEVGTGRWRIKIPVMVSDLDLEAKLWLKIRLAPMCPWIGTLGLGFVGAPSIKVQLAPYNRIPLMKIPILQAFLTKLITKDLPGLITLPKRLEINIPPAVTAVAEAAVGRDVVMRAVASAVLQADALEHALLAALPLGPQGAAGGVSLPDMFTGELLVTLHEARDLPVWGFPWQSNPYCRITLGSQAVLSRRESSTSHAGHHRAPVWNQDFQFLVEDPTNQALDIWIGDSPMTGRTEVGRAAFPLSQLAADGTADVWLPVESSMPGERSQGAVRLVITYKPFQDDVVDSGYRAAEAFGVLGGQEPALGVGITDVKSAADASSRAAVAASAAAAAVAVTKAAAARAAARIARGAVMKPPEQQQAGGNAPLQLPGASNGNGSGTGLAAAAMAAAAAASNGPPSGPTANGTTPTGSSTVDQLTAMAATMQKLTAEVDGIVHSGTTGAGGSGGAGGPNGGGPGASTSILAIDADLKVAAVEAVAAAEAAAITAVAAGDLAGANQVLQDAAAALQSSVAQLAAAEGAAAAASGSTAALAEAAEAPARSSGGGSSRALTPQERAQEALAAAHAAAAQAADAAAVAASASAAVGAQQQEEESSNGSSSGGGGGGALSSVHYALGLDAAPAAEAAEQRGLGLPVGSFDADGTVLPQEQQPWYVAATQLLPHSHPKKGEAAAEGAAAVGDGGAGVVLGAPAAEPEGVPQWPPAGSAASMDAQGPVTDIVIPANLPLDEITAEVLKSWKLRDTHVATLVQKAMEARRKQKERPWLQLLAMGAAASAVLLAAVLWRLAHMP